MLIGGRELVGKRPSGMKYSTKSGRLNSIGHPQPAKDPKYHKSATQNDSQKMIGSGEQHEIVKKKRDFHCLVLTA
jgi:hypothetical protein